MGNCEAQTNSVTVDKVREQHVKNSCYWGLGIWTMV